MEQSQQEGNKRDGNRERISTDTIQYSLFRGTANGLQVECHSDSGCWPVSEMLVPDPAREVRLPENGSHQFRGRVPVANPESILKTDVVPGKGHGRSLPAPAGVLPCWSFSIPTRSCPIASMAREVGKLRRRWFLFMILAAALVQRSSCTLLCCSVCAPLRAPPRYKVKTG